MICSAWSASPCPAGPSRKFWTSCFGWGACGMLFFCGIVFGNGRVRLYMALCLLLGATAYFLLLSPWTRAALDILARPPPGFWAG